MRWKAAGGASARIGSARGGRAGGAVRSHKVPSLIHLCSHHADIGCTLVSHTHTRRTPSVSILPLAPMRSNAPSLPTPYHSGMNTDPGYSLLRHARRMCAKSDASCEGGQSPLCVCWGRRGKEREEGGDRARQGDGVEASYARCVVMLTSMPWTCAKAASVASRRGGSPS